MKQYKVKDDPKSVITKARNLVEENIFAFELINENTNEVIFEVNAFSGAYGRCDGKYTDYWRKECKENKIWKYFDELDSDRYKDYAHEQLTHEEFSDAMDAWIYDMDADDENYENKLI